MAGVPEHLARTILDLVKRYLRDEYKIDLSHQVRGTLPTDYGGTGSSSGAMGPPGPTGPPGPAGPPGLAGPLDTLTDVTIASPVAGQVLRKGAGDWVNAQLAFADLGTTPTTLAGYGITDAYSKTAADARYAPIVHSQAWTTITGTPTTIAGYGITDAYTKTQIDTSLAGKANTATTLAGYGITDAYTKTQTDAAYAPISHTQAWSTITATPTSLAGYGITDAVTLGTVQTVTGAKTFQGNPGLTVDGGPGAGTIVFNAPPGFVRTMIFRSSLVNRWSMGANGTAESGSNVGSNFVFTSYDDSGASLSNALYMRRNGQIGINTVPAARLHIVESDAVTSTASTVVLKQHDTSGIPAAGFGARDRIQMHSSTNTTRSAFDQEVTWATATDATRKARVTFSVYDTLAREALRLEASGTAPMIGLLGAPAAPRQTLPAAATDPATTLALANAIRAALITYGLGA